MQNRLQEAVEKARLLSVASAPYSVRGRHRSLCALVVARKAKDRAAACNPSISGDFICLGIVKVKLDSAVLDVVSCCVLVEEVAGGRW